MKTMRFLTAAAISIALTFTFSGCSGDDGDDPPSSTNSSSSVGNTGGGGSSSSGDNTGGGDNQLVSGGGSEAWVSCEDDYCGGWVFQADGSCISLSKKDSDPWKIRWIASCSVNGGTIILDFCGEESRGTYTISGSSLTITFPSDEYEETFTKQSGIAYEVDRSIDDHCEEDSK